MREKTTAPTDSATGFAAACACFNLRRAARAVTGLYDALLQPTGLRATQATLLMALSVAGTATISRLAGALGMDRTTLTRELRPLEAQGLVRIVAGDDRRTRQVALTEAGEAKRLEIVPLWEGAQERVVVAGLGRERWERLRAELDEVVRLAHG